jgi:hypothetical protein
MSRRLVTFLLLTASTAIACGPQIGLPPTPLAFRTPEAAALAAAWRSREWRSPQAPLVVNIPPDTRDLQSLLAQDLSTWVSPIIVLRDSSPYASAHVSESQLRTWRSVFDVRPSRNVSSGPSSNQYAVNVEGCRGWPCHSGFVVEVKSESSGYVGTIIGRWVQ